MSHEDACTCIPAQDRIVIARRPDGLGALVRLHGLGEPFVRADGAARPTVGELRFRTPLGDNAAIVVPFVFVANVREDFLCPVSGAGAIAELIGEREHEDDARGLVVRIGLEDIEADTLGFARFIEQAIALGFLERRRNASRERV